MAQYLIGDQVPCKVSATVGFTDADYTSSDGVVVFLDDSDNATGPTPTIRKTPAAPAAPGTETHEPYGALANRIPAFGDVTGVSGNELQYASGANVTVSGIVAIAIPSGVTVDDTSIGEGIGYVITNPPGANDGLQPSSDGGGKIIARNGNTVYWDIRAK